MIFFQILDRLGECRECGRYAGTMQQGEEINIPCPPYDCKFVCFPLEANSVICLLCPWFLIRKAIWYVPNCRIYEYYVIFIYFQAAVSAFVGFLSLVL